MNGSTESEPMHDRLQGLLLLRVIATFMVVFGHASDILRGFVLPDDVPRMQSIAVMLFFCLSGYTIAWVCDSSRDRGLGRFIFDRFTRLAIPLAPIILGFFIIETLFYFKSHHPYAENLSLWDAIGNVFLIQNMRVPGVDTVQPFGLNRPLWTLSVEFWTYLAFAGFFFAVISPPRRRKTAAAITGLAALLLIMPFIESRNGAGSPLIWFAGALLYFTLKPFAQLTRGRSILLFPAWIVFALLLFKPAMWPENDNYSHLYNMIIFINFSFFLIVGTPWLNDSVLIPISERLGKFAYTTYLVHYPLLVMVNDYGAPEGRISVVFGSIAVFAAAWLISLPFEQRYKHIRNSLWDAMRPMLPVKASL